MPSLHHYCTCKKPTTRSEWAASIAVCLFVTVAILQVGIAVGILPSDIVWGGATDELTFRVSMASLVASAILCGMAYIIHRRAFLSQPSPFVRGVSWFIAAYMVLNTLGNVLGKTWVEQYVFGSMTAILSVCSFIVASSSSDEHASPEEGTSTTPYGSME